MQKWLKKIEYLRNKLSQVKGDEQSSVWEAYSSVLAEMPQDELDKYAKGLQEKEVARYMDLAEKIDTQNKEEFNSRSLNKLSLSQQVYHFLAKKIANLKLYDTEKGYKTKVSKNHKLYRFIKNISTINGAKKAISELFLCG